MNINGESYDAFLYMEYSLLENQTIVLTINFPSIIAQFTPFNYNIFIHDATSADIICTEALSGKNFPSTPSPNNNYMFFLFDTNTTTADSYTFTNTIGNAIELVYICVGGGGGGGKLQLKGEGTYVYAGSGGGGGSVSYGTISLDAQSSLTISKVIIGLGGSSDISTSFTYSSKTVEALGGYNGTYASGGNSGYTDRDLTNFTFSQTNGGENATIDGFFFMEEVEPEVT